MKKGDAYGDFIAESDVIYVLKSYFCNRAKEEKIYKNHFVVLRCRTCDYKKKLKYSYMRNGQYQDCISCNKKTIDKKRSKNNTPEIDVEKTRIANELDYWFENLQQRVKKLNQIKSRRSSLTFN